MKNPARGGIPLLEKIRKAKKIASCGCVSFREENWFSLLVFRFIVSRINHLTKDVRI